MPTDAELQAWPLPSPDDFDYTKIASRCGHMSEFAVSTGHAGICDIINFNGRLRNMEEVLVDLVTGDADMGDFIDRRINLFVAIMRRTLVAANGMISTAGPLAYGDADEVVANVRETLSIMMPGGGYALAPTHQIQDNSPTENVLAMYRAAHEYGRYV